MMPELKQTTTEKLVDLLMILRNWAVLMPAIELELRRRGVKA